MNRRQRGARSEVLAAQYLEKAGYSILERNYRTRMGEVDLVARKDQVIVFAEVKMRSSEAFGLPQEAVDADKQKKIVQVARHFLSQHPHEDCDIRFDVIAITGRPPTQQITHIENAFWVEP